MAAFSAGVPSTAVYFVSPRRMAEMAASLMLSGVAKSGSPAPRPMTSRPAAWRSRAFWETAMVGDGLMRDRRSARKLMTGSGFERRRDLTPDFPPEQRSRTALAAHRQPAYRGAQSRRKPP